MEGPAVAPAARQSVGPFPLEFRQAIKGQVLLAATYIDRYNKNK